MFPCGSIWKYNGKWNKHIQYRSIIFKGGIILNRIFKTAIAALIRLGAVLLPSSMVFAGLESDKADAEQQIADFKKLIEEANGNLNVILAEIAKVESNIAAIDKNLAKVNAEIASTESDIALKEADIAKALEIFNLKKQSFYDNFRSRYEEGELDYMSVILDAGDLTEFINYNEYYRVIKEAEQVRINEIKEARAALEAQKLELEAVKKTLADKKAEVEAEKLQQDIEKQKLASQKSYFATLSAQYKAEMAKQEAALASINQQIQEALRKAEENNQSQPAYTGNGVFAWPVPSSTRITSYYGSRTSPISGTTEFHKGIDISAAGGASIVAAESGTVLLSYYSSSFGNTVVINHGSGLLTLYAHMSSRGVSANQVVAKGQYIGAVGSTGYSTGNHLHFQVTNNGDIYNGTVDPMSYLK